MSLPSLRIGIDARALTHPQRGGFRSATDALVRGLIEIGAASDRSFLLYIDRDLPTDFPDLPPNIETRIVGGKRLQTDFRYFAAQVGADKLNLLHGMMNHVPVGVDCPTTVTIHDAFGIKNYPFTHLKRTAREKAVFLYTRWMTLLSAKRARLIATDSQDSLREIADSIGTQNALRVVYPGVALPPPQYNGERAPNTLLTIASPDPRKNLSLLYRALSPQNDYRNRFSLPPHLQIVCGDKRLAERTRAELQKWGLGDTELLVGLDNSTLADTYARATVFVFPSLREGFGLPPLEAMRCGCPVASSGAACLPETLGKAPLYFPPDDPQSLAIVVNRLLTDTDLRDRQREIGTNWAARYTCRAYAEDMIAFWCEALRR